MTRKSSTYEFSKIEHYWQAFWEEKKTFRARDFDARPKYYVLDMFPYPSGAGLHIGHPEGYTATDIVGRYKKAKGYNVLHPMGWDAFGLPAEQHAIKTGINPAQNTQANINSFRKQLKRLGLGLDWDREVDTTDPEYYKWTQWIFLQLFKHGLAYVDECPVWWCPALGTVLANEEVIDGKSERGNYPVERKNLRQWVLKITAYADKLLEGLAELDWPDSTKRQQIAWIGKSEGINVYFDVADLPGVRLTTFTTRVDTLFGVSYVAIAPEHPLLWKLVKPQKQEEVEEYIKEAGKKSDLARTDLAKDKSGVFTGSYCVNPINGECIEIWVADYVLISYGTGAVMGVPGHDERDYEFVQKFHLPVKAVLTDKVENENPPVPFWGDGYLIHSGKYNGLSTKQAKERIGAELQKNGHGAPAVNFKLRDWLFSRQRYWGEPFPVVWVLEEDYRKAEAVKDSPLHEFWPKEPVKYESEGKIYYAIPMATEQLPLLLPQVESYQPSKSGESPLAKATDWLQVYLNIYTGAIFPFATEKRTDGWVIGHRETNTMPQWAGSCWYFLRFCDPRNKNAFLDPKIDQYWGRPDLYIGGAEHSVLHLLYARFWEHVLYDLGLVGTAEPFPKVVHQGLILGEQEHRVFRDEKGTLVSAELVDRDACTHLETGVILKPESVSEEAIQKKSDGFVLKENPDIRVDSRAYKMSKSRGNVVNPDEIIDEYGTDALRLYEMFLGPLEAMKPWNTKGIEGVVRFLRRVWREYVGENGELASKIVDDNDENPETEKVLQETIKKVTEDIEALRFNTAISQMMIFLNHLIPVNKVSKRTAKKFIQLLAPFAPHIAEELWERLGEKPSITEAAWPEFDPSKLITNKVQLVVQINGKIKAEMTVFREISKEEVISLAKSNEKIKAQLEGKVIAKEIYVPGKIINLVIK